MKRLIYIFVFIFLLTSCGSSKPVTADDDLTMETETLEQKNRVALTLLTRIRQMPGIIVRGGVPVFTRNQTDIAGGFLIEPLYVLNGYIVGNSFRDISILVQSYDVKEIEAINGPSTAEYGSRGGGGVIKITTYQ